MQHNASPTERTPEQRTRDKEIARAYRRLTKSEAAESVLQHAYSLAGNADITPEIRAAFKALHAALSDHTETLRTAASASLIAP